MANILPACKLVDLDFAGIEAVTLGWFCARLTNDPLVIRFGKLGLHGLVTSHLVNEPVDLAQPDAVLAERFSYFKKKYKTGTDGRMGPYDMAKRMVHGTGYGLTPNGMLLMFPETYRDLKHAEQVQQVYFKVCPPVPAFQLDVKKRMAHRNYIGGPPKAGLDMLSDLNAHPFFYDHHFWNVVDYRKLSLAQARAYKAQRSAIKAPVVDFDGTPHAMLWGPDTKRGLAFYPQSSAAGILKEAEIELFDEPDSPTYIGDLYYGRTPLRAPIHDSLFMECPFRKVDRLLERAFTELLRPVEEMPMRPEWGMGPYLTIGVEGKVGDNWDDMQDVPTPAIDWTGVAGDRTTFAVEEIEDEQVFELGTVA